MGGVVGFVVVEFVAIIVGVVGGGGESRCRFMASEAD